MSIAEPKAIARELRMPAGVFSRTGLGKYLCAMALTMVGISTLGLRFLIRMFFFTGLPMVPLPRSGLTIDLRITDPALIDRHDHTAASWHLVSSHSQRRRLLIV
jgi:hypothetical protein